MVSLGFTYMIKMFDNISWQSILSFDENFNDFEKVVRTDVKDLNYPWKGPDKTRKPNID